jgi:hypothetical protein
LWRHQSGSKHLILLVCAGMCFRKSGRWAISLVLFIDLPRWWLQQAEFTGTPRAGCYYKTSNSGGDRHWNRI